MVNNDEYIAARMGSKGAGGRKKWGHEREE